MLPAVPMSAGAGRRYQGTLVLVPVNGKDNEAPVPASGLDPDGARRGAPRPACTIRRPHRRTGVVSARLPNADGRFRQVSAPVHLPPADHSGCCRSLVIGTLGQKERAVLALGRVQTVLPGSGPTDRGRSARHFGRTDHGSTLAAGRQPCRRRQRSGPPVCHGPRRAWRRIRAPGAHHPTDASFPPDGRWTTLKL
jgi:hypothetical protein